LVGHNREEEKEREVGGVAFTAYAMPDFLLYLIAIQVF